MKNTLLLIVLCLCLNATVFGQNEFKGLWVVCDSTENCKDGPTPLCMRIADSTISYVMSLSTGVDSDILGIAYYKIEDSILKTVDTNYTGKVSTNEFQMKWQSEKQLELIDLEDEFHMYLFRKEE